MSLTRRLERPPARLRRTLGALLLGLLAFSGSSAAETERSRALPARESGDGATAVGTSGAVTSAEANASQVGLDVLRRGGNAVDAAVAVGFALGVTHPSAGNPGGGGFMLIYRPDQGGSAIDYRERAPAAASADMYIGENGEPTDGSRVGALAAGIPGNVAGLARAHALHGSLAWEELLRPAIELARDGWELDSFHAKDLEYAVRAMRRHGFEASAAHFRRLDGSAYREGDVWRQPELARTLERIAREGPDAFYRGELAEHMAEQVRLMGGIWTAEDLAAYAPVEREPVSFEYRGHRILSMPPPSAGGVVLRQILAAGEALGLHELAWRAPERAHLYLEVLRRVYAERNRWLGDPDYVDIPLEDLLSPEHAARRIADIDPFQATPSREIDAGRPLLESTETTHFSIVDRSGWAVANTFTLNGGFGAKLLIPGTGILLNNEMDDFTTRPGRPNMFGLVQGTQNAVAPGKRMLSSMTPTIVLREGELRAVLGSPGGPTITTTVAQILMQMLDYGRDVSRAVREPRLHHQWLPDLALAEEGLDPELVSALEARGHRVILRPRIGHANCIEVDPSTRGYRAVADVARDGGKALAY